MNAARKFEYSSGEAVLDGDIVSVNGKAGVVESVLQPGDQRAIGYSCADTGGVLITFNDGDLQLWPNLDEDLVLIARGTPPST